MAKIIIIIIIIINYNHETHALYYTRDIYGWWLTDLSMIAYVFHAYNLAFILILPYQSFGLCNVR